MWRTRLFNEMDVLGAGAVLFAYLNWASYQVSQRLRSEWEVHVAVWVALMLGLAYRLGRHRVKPLYDEVAARVILLVSGLLAFSGWGTEAVALVAGANLWFLLHGARFSRMDNYAYRKMAPLLYLLLVLISPENKYEELPLRWIIGAYLMSLFIAEPLKEAHGGANPYMDVAGLVLSAVVLLFLPVASVTLLIFPRSATPEAQMLERIFAGIGLCLLLIVAVLYVWERRCGSGQSHLPDARGR
ncbi:MAG: hypothetical protein RMM08_09875 [Armatimonadota bacterium]|nr:hypothetical protein [bacterium]MDW8321661.1 hypothetical protein [Armatimonadota bacterium]